MIDLRLPALLLTCVLVHLCTIYAHQPSRSLHSTSTSPPARLGRRRPRIQFLPLDILRNVKGVMCCGFLVDRLRVREEEALEDESYSAGGGKRLGNHT